MTIFLSLLFIVLGIGLLMKGADWLVSGASSLAQKFGVSPIVIGLTIVSFGTSLPELIVSLYASIQGATDVALGNIIGSNIANILLIGGISAAIYPLRIQKNTVWKEIPLALLAMILLWIMSNDRLLAGRSVNMLDRIDGLTLISFFIIFLYYTFGISKTEGEAGSNLAIPQKYVTLSIIGGLVALFFGGRLTVQGATDLAAFFGLSERFIGLTIVAVGTSLPELITSAVAAYRKQLDIALGNIVGSNIFNVFFILGTSAMINGLPVAPQYSFDFFTGIIASLLLFLTAFVGKKHLVERWQGVGFILLYAVYTILIIVR